MRIRIISPHPGEVDGIPLSVFQAGLAYDVSSILATYLITMGCAEAVIDDNPRPVTPLPDLPEDIAVQVQNRQQSRRMNKGMAGESLDRSGR